MKPTIEQLIYSVQRIPEGSFFADLSDEQIRGILLQEKIGKTLARDYPEIAELYRDLENFQTLYQIGEQYVSSSHSYD